MKPDVRRKDRGTCVEIDLFVGHTKTKKKWGEERLSTSLLLVGRGGEGPGPVKRYKPRELLREDRNRGLQEPQGPKAGQQGTGVRERGCKQEAPVSVTTKKKGKKSKQKTHTGDQKGQRERDHQQKPEVGGPKERGCL